MPTFRRPESHATFAHSAVLAAAICTWAIPAFAADATMELSAWLQWVWIVVVGVLGVLLWKSERHRRNLVTARDSPEEMLSRVVALSPLSICIADATQPDFPLVYVNPGFERLTGYSFAEACGRNCRFLQGSEPDVSDAAERAGIRECLERGREARFTLRNYRKDGTPFDNEFTLSPIRDGAGRVTHVVGVQTNVTERNAFEHRLAEGEARFRAVFQSLVEGVLIVGADGRISGCNPAFEGMTGLTHDQVVGRTSLLPLISAYDDRGQPIGPNDTPGRLALSIGEDVQTRAIRMVRPDGGERWLVTHARPMFDESSKRLLGVAITHNDITEARKAMDAVQESEGRFRDLAELSSDWYWEQDAQGRFTYLSSNLPVHFGIDISKLIGKTRRDDSIRRFDESQLTALEALIAERKSFRDFELSQSTAMGEAWITLSGKPMYDSVGAFVGYRGTGRDITAVRMAQQTISASEQRFRDLTKLSADWYWETDEKGRFVYVSDGVKRSLGLSPDEMISERVGLRDLARDRSMARDLDAAIARSVEFRGIEYVAKTPVGETTIGVSGRPLLDASGRLTGYRGICRDITGQRNAERVVSEQRTFLREVLDATPNPIFALDRAGCLRIMNVAFAGLFGKHPRELAGRLLSDVCPDLPAGALGSEGARASTMSGTTVQEFSFSFPVGGQRAMLAVARALNPTDTSREGSLIVWTDISARKEAEARVQRLNENLEAMVAARTRELEASNRELESFSYSVSHDLRAPVRAISGFTELLVEHLRDGASDDTRTLLGRIIDNAQRMGELIDDLLEFARIGRADLAWALVNTDELVRDVQREILETEKGVHIEFVLRDLPTVYCDPTLLRQVWMNLLVNAVKFSRGRDVVRIEVGATQYEGQTVFEVRDNGVGFDEKYSHKLFGVFQRLHSAREFPGTGVGLAIVHRIVTRHGGRVWARSEMGHGATFSFALPVRKPTSTERTGRDSAQAGSQEPEATL